MNDFSPVVMVIALFAGLSACAHPSPPGDLDALFDKQIGAMTGMSTARADALLLSEPPRLQLPLPDHLSAVQYCAFHARVLPTSREADLAELRRKTGLLPAPTRLSDQVLKAIGFDELFPLVRNAVTFDRATITTSSAGPATFVGTDTGLCAVLTLAQPDAEQKTRTWLGSPASGWVSVGKSRGWRAYRVRDPSPWEADLVLLEAGLSENSRKLGVSAVHLVAVRGLP